jgi:hypothetical protein
MKNKHSVKGINANQLRRYLETRKDIAKRTDRIGAIAHLLGLLRHCGDDTVPVSPHALAVTAQMIDSDTCGIVESLDEFIFLTDAEETVEKSDG